MDAAKARVLIVDDEESVRNILSRELETEGYNCVTAADGKEAMETASMQDFDLVLTDVTMPGMSGMEVLSQMATNHPDTCVIMMTGLADAQTAVEAMKAGAYDYIAKPLDLNDLGMRAKRALERKRLILQNRRLDLLREVGSKAGSVSEVSKLLDQIMRMTQQTLKASSSSVLLLDEQKQELFFELAEGEVGQTVKQMRISTQSGIAGWVARHGKPSIVNDVTKDQRFCRDVDEITGFVTRSIICAPLMVHGKLIGLIEVINKLDGSDFDEQDLEVLVAVASTAAMAIESKRAEEELAEYRHHLEELVEKRTTELNNTTEQLEFAEETYRTVFENSAVAITVADENENIISWNKFTGTLLGIDRDDLYMKPVSSLYPEEEWRKIRAQNVRQKGMQYHLQTKLIRKDQQPLDVDLSLSVLRGPDGKVTGSIGIIADITVRKQAEEELKRTIAALECSNAELEQFAYVASHDLQEPLRMVTNYVELLAENYKGKLDADADDFIAYAVDGATRMHLLIKDLLAYSRVRSRAEPFEPTDCTAVLDQALSNLQAAVEDNGAVVTHDSLPTVVADDSQLGQLFQNLISNAIKFHGEGPPRVHISAKQSGNEWVFSVQDSGIGMEPEYGDRIFVIFQRLHGQNAYPGTGIGLAICKKIVERHSGRIWVESEPGKGSIFYFTIPTKGHEEP